MFLVGPTSHLTVHTVITSEVQQISKHSKHCHNQVAALQWSGWSVAQDTQLHHSNHQAPRPHWSSEISWPTVAPAFLKHKDLSADFQGLVNVPIEHHPTIGDINSNRYLKVIFKIPKKGHLPTPDFPSLSATNWEVRLAALPRCLAETWSTLRTQRTATSSFRINGNESTKNIFQDLSTAAHWKPIHPITKGRQDLSSLIHPFFDSAAESYRSPIRLLLAAEPWADCKEISRSESKMKHEKQKTMNRCKFLSCNSHVAASGKLLWDVSWFASPPAKYHWFKTYLCPISVPKITHLPRYTEFVHRIFVFAACLLPPNATFVCSIPEVATKSLLSFGDTWLRKQGLCQFPPHVICLPCSELKKKTYDNTCDSQFSNRHVTKHWDNIFVPPTKSKDYENLRKYHKSRGTLKFWEWQSAVKMPATFGSLWTKASPNETEAASHLKIPRGHFLVAGKDRFAPV